MIANQEIETWEKSEGEPALVRAVTLCMYARSEIVMEIERVRTINHDFRSQDFYSSRGWPKMRGLWGRDWNTNDLLHLGSTCSNMVLPFFQLQSWWRGTMVRKQLGPYSKKKKKKGKKGKKSGKKGGKKKKK